MPVRKARATGVAARMRRAPMLVSLVVCALMTVTLAAAAPSHRPTSGGGPAAVRHPEPSPPAPQRPQASGALTWYVSRHGDNVDGRSWATAWNELDRINWSLVRPGDVVLVDGGARPCRSNYTFANHETARPGLSCGMLYRTPLSVRANGTPAAPVTVRLANEAGRNGTAVVFGGRASKLPHCNQADYKASGRAAAFGIAVPGMRHVVIDGGHRSGIMVYGAESGVDLVSDATAFVTLRNLEIFDNGTAGRWAHGYRTDGEGISLVGHDITVDRSLIHDNGQDAVQDRYTGPINNDSHAPLSNIAVTNSWLYVSREHPVYRGYGFNSGSQAIESQDCAHVDGIQIWGGGLHQRRLTVDHSIFGPFLAQGVYPANRNTTSFDDVTITNTLFLDILNHSIIGDRVASDRNTPANWKIRRVTSYLSDEPGSRRGALDLAGVNHSVRNSIFYNGYFADAGSVDSAGGNVFWGGDRVPGGTRDDPGFPGPLPSARERTFASLVGADFTPTCRVCAGAGSPLHGVKDLLDRIDALDRRGVNWTAPPTMGL